MTWLGNLDSLRIRYWKETLERRLPGCQYWFCLLFAKLLRRLEIEFHGLNWYSRMPKKKTAPATTLKGWKAIAKFLGTSPASAQTWAKQGMPVKREGRFTVADPMEVQAWLGQQSHMPKPAHILTNDIDIAAALKDSISAVKRKK